MSLIKRLIKATYLQAFFTLFKLFPVKKKRVLFSSFYGRQCSGDPKAIYEKLLSLKTEHELIWVLNKPGSLSIKAVNRYSLKHLFYLATCEFRIDNCQESHYLKPKSSTTYIQTWHGSPLKKIAQDLDDAFIAHKQDWLLDANYWDFLFAPSIEIAEIFSKAFKIDNKKVINTGNPRNEILGNSDTILMNKVKTSLNIPSTKKIILYAPTFRDDEQGKFYLKLSKDKIVNALGSDYLLLVRLHSNIKHLVNGSFDNENIMNVTEYDDIQELMLISDILITDYSSVFFDFAITEKPMLFYPYDIDKYKNTLRGFYFDYQSTVPGKVVYDEDSLIEAILKLESKEYKESELNGVKLFNQKFNENKVDSINILKQVGLLDEA